MYLLLGNGGQDVAANLAALGARVSRAAWSPAGAEALSLLAGARRLVLIEPGLDREAVMSWVVAAGARGIETLAPADALPVLALTGEPTFRLGERRFYRFAAPRRAVAVRLHQALSRVAALLALPA
ncbi:MAG: hypothetical protein PHR35_21120, partial [Kiritimatiellae bacterium]|nr:hypothetical protein [Kiritimatiellia bacterium]